MTTNTEQPDLISRLTEINQKGISKADMARIAGVSKQAVSGWFRTGTISKKSALAIAEAAGVSVAWLYGESVEKKSGLGADEMELLRLYRQLPEPEQRNMIAVFGARLKELDEYVEKYARKRIKGVE
ncbi:helix-turn-helix domain-containing protein [Serratia sp. JSRIV001]|uniref:helix-turn-helix domain-containing protein n=1 Tax=Serratia TaxID=613 RepID=UPI000938B514|nr:MULTISPECIES: helix-turn-helix domain-containing protein [Serratia]OKP15531.1 transcriptional regulator [Serratia fonticola]UAN48019.1 helix-turn-helix domain-containing protein [Serratia sp. JSRIV001]UAN53800.1 helix-turn-helix domain-containing protein [Serratia sp. JSRIV002]UAN65125.1 helix-turn-helix domain-containing protein [Serratia sp. JSRIV006]